MHTLSTSNTDRSHSKDIWLRSPIASLFCPSRWKNRGRVVFRGLTFLGLGGAVVAGWSDQVMSQGPAIAYPNYNWSYSDHASTYQEGTMRGQAAILSSSAELSYLNSVAAINFQEAQRRSIENSVAYMKAYLDRKEMRDEYMERYRPKPFVGEARQKVVDYYRPKKLSAAQYDGETGKITWPHILRQVQYAPVRNEVDAIFANRSFENSGNGSDSQLQVKKLIKTFSALVRENLHAMSAEQYIEVQGFLRSVDAEAKLQAPPKVDQAGIGEPADADPAGNAPAVNNPNGNGVPAAVTNPQAKLPKSKQEIEI